MGKNQFLRLHPDAYFFPILHKVRGVSDPVVFLTGNGDLIMAAQEHAGLDKAGKLGILRIDDLHILGLDLHQSHFLILIVFGNGAGKGLIIDPDLSVTGINLAVKNVVRPGLFHNMDGIGRDFYTHLGPYGSFFGGMHHPLIPAAVHADLIVYTHEHHTGDSALDHPRFNGHDVYILRAHHGIHLYIFAEACIHAGIGHAVHAHLIILRHDGSNDVALPDKVRHENVFGLVIDIFRPADLLDDPVLHDHNGIGHGQRFGLIVCNVNKGDPQGLLHTF